MGLFLCCPHRTRSNKNRKDSAQTVKIALHKECTRKSSVFLIPKDVRIQFQMFVSQHKIHWKCDEANEYIFIDERFACWNWMLYLFHESSSNIFDLKFLKTVHKIRNSSSFSWWIIAKKNENNLKISFLLKNE